VRRAGLAAAVAALLLASPLAAQEPADTLSTEALVAAAREAARTDRNAESAALFERAIARDPARRAALLQEYADQVAYAGRAAQAVPLYRAAIAAGAGDPRRVRMGLALALSWAGRLRESQAEYHALVAAEPGDVEARLQYARVLSWRGRLVASRREYQEALRREPGNLGARRELLQVESWRGRHRRAAAGLADFLREYPDDAEAALFLAQAQDWMGRPDRAAATLAGVLRDRPGQPEAARRLAELRARARPRTALHRDASAQSDRLSIQRTGVEQHLPFGYGRGALVVRAEAQDYEAAGAQPDVRVQRPGLGARYRFADWGELNAHVHAERADVRPGTTAAPDGLAFRDRAPATYDAWLTLWPSDVLRLDVAANRATFDNVRSLAGGIVADGLTLSADVLPSERARFTARAGRAAYSDGNRRLWGQGEAEYRLLANPRVSVGARSTALSFARQLDHGYFNPRRYVSHVAPARASGGFLGRGWYEVEGTGGHEVVWPGGGKPLWSAGARATWQLWRGLELEGRAFHFSSRVASSGGFARTGGGVSLRTAW
jgi:thioredoxin-like negative regulator of GroEL